MDGNVMKADRGKAAEQQGRKKRGVGQKTPAEPPTYISYAFAATE
jgi:hypothetical protein